MSMEWLLIGYVSGMIMYYWRIVRPLQQIDVRRIDYISVAVELIIWPILYIAMMVMFAIHYPKDKLYKRKLAKRFGKEYAENWENELWRQRNRKIESGEDIDSDDR